MELGDRDAMVNAAGIEMVGAGVDSAVRVGHYELDLPRGYLVDGRVKKE